MPTPSSAATSWHPSTLIHRSDGTTTTGHETTCFDTALAEARQRRSVLSATRRPIRPAQQGLKDNHHDQQLSVVNIIILRLISDRRAPLRPDQRDGSILGRYPLLYHQRLDSVPADVSSSIESLRELGVTVGVTETIGFSASLRNEMYSQITTRNIVFVETFLKYEIPGIAWIHVYLRYTFCRPQFRIYIL